MEENLNQASAGTPPSKSPRFFLLIGWSWLVLGALGVLLGILSLPSLFQVDHIRTLFDKQPYSQIPGFQMMVEKVIRYYVPLTFGQLTFSIGICWASWFFLIRKNIGRLVLSVFNVVSMLGLVAAAHYIVAFFQHMSNTLGIPALVEAGLVKDIPLILTWTVWGSTILMILPLFWMAWYFHSPAVCGYFNKNS
ncbi:hypothetical protein BVX98_01885 [bacterium F11]|nr:hypothetical protein BVX98_01885 [bacterium F11]